MERECGIFVGNSRSGTHALHAWIIDQQIEDWTLTKARLSCESLGPRMKKHTLLAFESQPLEEVETYIQYFAQNDIELKFVFILLRDPFNWLASYLEFMRKYRGKRSLKKKRWRVDFQIELWKEYARQFSEPRIPKTICVSYNSWFTSEEYRRTISDKIGNRFSEATVKIPGKSRSSFEDEEEDASQRAVLDRWSSRKQHKCRKIVSDPELLSLCKDISGATDAYRQYSK